MAWIDDLVLVLLFAALVWLIFFKRRLDQWLVEKLEKRTFAEPQDPRQTAHESQPIFFPVATCVGLGFVIGILALMHLASTTHTVATILVTSTIFICTVIPGLVAVTFYCHYTSTCTRRLNTSLPFWRSASLSQSTLPELQSVLA